MRAKTKDLAYQFGLWPVLPAALFVSSAGLPYRRRQKGECRRRLYCYIVVASTSPPSDVDTPGSHVRPRTAVQKAGVNAVRCLQTPRSSSLSPAPSTRHPPDHEVSFCSYQRAV